MNTKHLLQSKTVWLNVITLLLLLWPAARNWVAANPVEPLAVLGALNILVRWISKDAVSLFPDASDNSDDGNDSPMVPCWLVGLGLAGVVGTMSLPACSTAQLEAAKNIPVQACYIDQAGNRICYSTQSGVLVEVDERSGK